MLFAIRLGLNAPNRPNLPKSRLAISGCYIANAAARHRHVTPNVQWSKRACMHHNDLEYASSVSIKSARAARKQRETRAADHIAKGGGRAGLAPPMLFRVIPAPSTTHLGPRCKVSETRSSSSSSA